MMSSGALPAPAPAQDDAPRLRPRARRLGPAAPRARTSQAVVHNTPDATRSPGDAPAPHANSKFYDRESGLVFHLPEDPRISKLLRRLCAESDMEKSLAICAKLHEAVILPENARYVRRSYELLAESLLEVLYDAPGPETKEGAAVALGRIGRAMGPDFDKHLDWISGQYPLHDASVKRYLVLSFCETFRLDGEARQLSEFAARSMDRLQSFIEGTDSADIFMSAVDAMVILSDSYPEEFSKHFIDTVDILVGWHVDNTQPKKIKEFAVKTLFKLSRHWQANISFSVSLLTQFIEDVVAYGNDLTKTETSDPDQEDSQEECVQKITSFINVFNIVVKSLGALLSPNVSINVTWVFLSECMSKVLQVLLKAVKSDADDDLLLAGNECVCLLLEYLQLKISSSSTLLFKLIDLEQAKYLNSEDSLCCSIIDVIAKTIKEVSSNLPIEFINKIIGPGSLLRPLRFSECTPILDRVLSVYANLLNLKNIPLLQETYKYVLTDLQNACKLIVPDVQIIQPGYGDEMSQENAEKNVIFYLQCLSELANASNSIIGMWALQPSILELLAVKMNPHNKILSIHYPALQYSLLYLLYSHCKKNNHFIASSELVSSIQHRANVCDIFGLTNLSIGDVSTSSPTSGHFGIILNTLTLVLKADLPDEGLLLMLTWISDIFYQADKYLTIINHSNAFVQLLISMISLGNHFNVKVAEAVVKNLKQLLNNNSVTWNNGILTEIASLCLLQIDNNDSSVSSLFMSVLFEIPCDIVQMELDKQVVTSYSSRRRSTYYLNINTKVNALKDYMMRGPFVSLSSQHFKIIIGTLLHPTFEEGNSMLNAFLTCWPLQSQESDECNLMFFRQCAVNFSSICNAWAMSELAQLFVSLKLRTPLGKPQESFMRVEGALKGIAREITSTDTKFVASAKVNLLNVVTMEQMRSRKITEFMLCLEKYIYNAAEGTAIVLPTVSKPVRTFFHTNWSTCREWLTRVRPASLAVSLFAGHYGGAIYHAQVMLHTASLTTTNIDIEAIAISVSRALIKLQEPELLLGLYIWIQQTFNKKFQWLKAAAEQAHSRHEIALEYYKKLNTSLTKQGEQDSGEALPVDTRGSRFLQEQISDCYKNIQSWEEMEQWQRMDQIKNNSPWHPFTALKTFDENTEFPNDLCNWDILNFDSDSISKNSCSYQHLLNKVESTLVWTAVNMYYTEDLNKYSNIIQQCQYLLNAKCVEFTRSTSPHFLKEISVLQLANEGLRRITVDGKAIPNPFKPSSEKLSKYGTQLENLSKIMWWNQYFTKLNMSDENLYYTECLRLDLIKSARKNANNSWGKRELLKHFKSNTSFQSYLGNMSSLNELCEVLLVSNNTYDFDIWSPNNATALVELCKLLYASEETKTKAINVCASVSLGVSQRLAMGEQNYDLREKGTRMLLTLSKWVQNENEDIIIKNLDSPLTKLITALPEIGLVDNNISANVIPLSDSAVGKLLQFSVNQCPGLAKAWSNFAAWCFRWGRKMVEYSSKTGEQLTDGDKLQIESVMLGCSPQDFEAVCEILSKTKAMCCDDEDIDWNEINTSEMIENQLRSVPSLSNAFPEHLALLVDIWRQAQKRVFSYYELSADAYFKFLQLICASDYINHSGEYDVVSATLRLLRLIVKHAMELQTVLESGLASTPTQPWKVIIPQLFSRLNHPETYVRKCVSDLLCRLAEDTPHLITFPAVVGAVENEQIDLTELNFTRPFLPNSAEIEGQDNSDCESEKFINNELNSCFLDMVETLSKQAPETILQVKLLVKELQRINLLWDELWLGTLAQHHSEFTKRLAQLENEVAKVKSNPNLSPEDKTRLIKEKHRIIFDPIIFVLEQLDRITSANPETPHEISFQYKFQSLISDVILKLKNPVNAEKPQESWIPLKQLQIKFQQKVNKRTSYILKMSDISPILAQLNNTVISMPGVQGNQNARITIKSVENNVAILPTKTKPKKLVFYGSDGKPYTYLFKGLEDLHLDERIMQFLSIANTMMARDTENNENQTYRARHYSVIPLGPRSGLISWVDNVTPLFALYKRWQHREAAITAIKSNKTVNVLRPSELFYNKLNPLLQTAGVSTENRKEWPVSILKQVLLELIAETPSDLLWRELWCGSVTPDQWWQTVRRYSYSMAVMSTIGYIIGLGDRHLDNVLVDLTTGEVVHIDYNVCFEKGKTLRVPEKVPFRMTPNLVHALGVTGVEGIFRLACEHVLKVMRRGRETLLTLLEAFVYDPLVEWGGGGAGGGAGATATSAGGSATRRRRRQLEARAAADMFAVRCQEIRHDWNENKDLLLSTLPAVKENADKWLEENNALKALEARLQDCHQQMGLIKEVEAYGSNLKNHPLHAISQKYTTYKQAKNAVEHSMKVLVKIVEDFDNQIEGYNAAMEAINGPQLVQWVQDFSGHSDQDDQRIFDLIKDFLTNAGQSSMISQCEQAESELIHSLQQVNALLRSCIDLLSQYAAIAQYYPQSYTEHHKIVTFRKWIAAVLETKSPEMCREISGQVATALAGETPNNPAAQQIVAFNYHLQTINAEANVKLNKAIERFQLDGGLDAVGIAHEGYIEAKNNVSTFVRQEKGAAAAMECVAVGRLCDLNRRYLMLESGAQSAGDCLVDLTSREGEWFLGDMSATSAQIVELLLLIPLKSASGDDGAIPIAINSVRNANLIFDDLVELNFNFQTIILPEALKKIHAEEPTVLLMITELNAVIVNTPCPLNELLGQLEMHLRYLITDMESPSPSCQVLVADLRARFEALMSSELILGPDEVSKAAWMQSSGRMLLMGFNGLFAPLTVHGADLMDALMSLLIPHVWKKIDQISEAIDMSAPLQSEHIRSVLDDIFLIKRIQAIAEVFALCAQMSCAFKGIGPVVIFDEERLCKPVKRFTADYVGRQLLGVHSRALGTALCLLLRRTGLDLRAEIEQKEIGASWKVSLEGLCSKAAESRGCSAALLERAAALAGAVERARRRRDAGEALRRAKTAAQVTARCVRLRLAAHARLHAVVLGADGAGGAAGAADPAPALARRALELAAAAEKLHAARTKAKTLVAAAHQRVKWGAGANPALGGPLAALERGWDRRAARADALHATARALVAHARALAAARASHAKMSRTIRQALANWEKACGMAIKCVLNVSPVEESLMELLHPEGVIDVQWVENVSALLREMTQQVQREAGGGRERVRGAGARLAAAAARVAAPHAQHAALLAEVRPLLQTLAHNQHHTEGEPAAAYLAQERAVADMLREVLTARNADGLDEAAALACGRHARHLAHAVESLYDGLLRMESWWRAGCEGARGARGGAPGPPVALKPNTKQGEQNAQGAGVWKRVRLKLEGRDPDPDRRCGAHEQVEYILSEAMSADNLCVLYEGWMAWV